MEKKKTRNCLIFQYTLFNRVNITLMKTQWENKFINFFFLDYSKTPLFFYGEFTLHIKSLHYFIEKRGHAVVLENT